MDQAQAAQSFASQRVVFEFGDYKPLFITDNDILNDTMAINQNPQLSSQFLGELPQAVRKFRGAALGRLYPAAVEPL